MDEQIAVTERIKLEVLQWVANVTTEAMQRNCIYCKSDGAGLEPRFPMRLRFSDGRGTTFSRSIQLATLFEKHGQTCFLEDAFRLYSVAEVAAMDTEGIEPWRYIPKRQHR